jgi:hypothetical protein|tara:strand:- start:316 stop:1026 length:711 start_codon:yes stop_codon:yes gene_type:complete
MSDNILDLVGTKDSNAPSMSSSIDDAVYTSIASKDYNPNNNILYEMMLNPRESSVVDFSNQFVPKNELSQDFAETEDLSLSVLEPHINTIDTVDTAEDTKPQFKNDINSILTNYNHPLYLDTVRGQTIPVTNPDTGEEEIRTYDKNGYSYTTPGEEGSYTQVYKTSTHNPFSGKPNAGAYDDLQKHDRSLAQGDSKYMWGLIGAASGVGLGYGLGYQLLNAAGTFGGDIYDWWTGD